LKSSILVTHPGRQHSHRAALALEEAGVLAGYWAGVPALEAHRGLVPKRLWERFVRYAPVGLPPAKVASAIWVPAMRRLGDRFPRGISSRIDLAACRLFDRWAANRSSRTEANAVLACEISARDTFRAARRRGWVTLLDAPAIHPDSQERWHGHSEPDRVNRRLREIKFEEIELADAVVTVSEFARETYLSAGVPAEKVLAVSLGADLDLFGRLARSDRSGALRIVFAGAPIERKGFDLLVAACEQLLAQNLPFALRLVGPRGAQSHLVERLPRTHWSSSGPLPQSGLAEELAAADLLVLPSRNDSYGMVVAEALASGTPAIVSSHVGAQELIEAGRTGWIVQAGEVDDLGARLAACAADPGAVRAMTLACRERSLGATWEAYGRRLVAALEPVLERRWR
jgi:glycosyltransferase involved in cell wall biosynthesis